MKARFLPSAEMELIEKPGYSRIDDAALAPLLPGLHEGARAWKSFDGDAMNRVHAQGPISDPVGRAKSVVFTPEGRTRAEALLPSLFAQRG